MRKLLCSCVSIRRSAEILRINRKTVARKLVLLGFEAELALRKENSQQAKARVVEFDDLETFEHTKCKPLSVTLMVESGTRRILDLEVSQFAAKGMLVERSKKYGPRPDFRKRARNALFSRVKDLVEPDALIKSDSNPYYSADVKAHFPSAQHRQYKGKRGSSGGQGEIKRVVYDPIFSLNHTCAMKRANVNRLVRKTWCTTKRAGRLRAHLFLFAQFHNSRL